jgi:hypothetical protein
MGHQERKTLERLQQSVSSAIAGLSAEEMSWRPPGKWSAAEVFEHLYLTYTGTIKGFERVVAAGNPFITSPSWTQRARKLVVLGLGYLPSGREAPSFTRPRGLPTEKVLAEIVPKIAEMDDFLCRCEENLGRGKLLDHPILGPLTASEWKKFHLVHGRHHLKQVWRLREEMLEKNKRRS